MYVSDDMDNAEHDVDKVCVDVLGRILEGLRLNTARDQSEESINY
mgnify:CR=1 FL=1